MIILTKVLFLIVFLSPLMTQRVLIYELTELWCDYRRKMNRGFRMDDWDHVYMPMQPNEFPPDNVNPLQPMTEDEAKELWIEALENSARMVAHCFFQILFYAGIQGLALLQFFIYE